MDTLLLRASIPWLEPLLDLIQEDRASLERSATTAAYRLVADVRKDLSDDEGMLAYLSD